MVGIDENHEPCGFIGHANGMAIIVIDDDLMHGESKDLPVGMREFNDHGVASAGGVGGVLG